MLNIPDENAMEKLPKADEMNLCILSWKQLICGAVTMLCKSFA